jgi:hypothetical protein
MSQPINLPVDLYISAPGIGDVLSFVVLYGEISSFNGFTARDLDLDPFGFKNLYPRATATNHYGGNSLPAT